MPRCTRRAAALLMLPIVAMTACKGGEGPTGPQGPVGAQGPAGNANVKTKIVAVTNSQWLWNDSYTFTTATGGYTSYFTRYADLTEPLITDDILNNGMVLVFFRPWAASTDWAPLPYSFLAFGGAYYFNIVAQPKAGKVRLHYFWTSNGSGSTPTNLSSFTIPDYTFKYVIVQGTALASMRASGIDLTSHDAVTGFIGGI